MSDQNASATSRNWGNVWAWVAVILTFGIMCMLCSVWITWETTKSLRALSNHLERIDELLTRAHKKPADIATSPTSTESPKSDNSATEKTLESLEKEYEENLRQLPEKEQRLWRALNTQARMKHDLVIHLADALERQKSREFGIFGDIKFLSENNIVTFTGFQTERQAKIVCSIDLDRISVNPRRDGSGVSVELRDWQISAGTREEPETIHGQLATILVPNIRVAVAWLRAIERWKKEREEYLAKFKPRVVLPPKEKKEPF